VAQAAPSATSCEREIILASIKHGIPLQLLYAIGAVESGRQNGGQTRLHAFALNVDGTGYFARDKADAIKHFQAARATGAVFIDVGCMQVNHHYHGAAFGSVADMLDAARNVDYAAGFLKSLYEREGNWTSAAARYHAGAGNTTAQRAYVCRVSARLVAAGFGSWTSEARSTCEQ
jgi:hypothetical protein